MKWVKLEDLENVIYRLKYYRVGVEEVVVREDVEDILGAVDTYDYEDVKREEE